MRVPQQASKRIDNSVVAFPHSFVDIRRIQERNNQK